MKYILTINDKDSKDLRDWLRARTKGWAMDTVVSIEPMKKPKRRKRKPLPAVHGSAKFSKFTYLY